MEKGKKVTKKEEQVKSKKSKKTEQKEKKPHVALNMVGMLLLIFITCFIIVTLRKFYILNTYAIAMEEYSKKDNYTIVLDSYDGIDNVSFYKEGKSVFIIKPTENRQMYHYNDGNISILKIDSDGDKVAVISKESTITGPRIISAFGEGMTVGQNFLLSLTSIITEEECNEKNCYKVSLNGMKVWIDKETYLTVKISNGYSVSADGTKTPTVTNYSYQFGTVTDEQVAKPDLTGYKIQEQ